MPTVTIDIRPEYVRAAIQSAVGLGLKFPSIEAERHVARILSRVWTVVETTLPEPAEPEPTGRQFIVEFPLSGRWVRSTDYPGTYTSAEADKIMTDDFTGIRVGYRINFASEKPKPELYIIEMYWGGWSRSLSYPDVYSAKRADEIISSSRTRSAYRKTVYL